MSAESVRTIAILGSGVKLWLATAVLAKSFRPWGIKLLSIDTQDSEKPAPLQVFDASIHALLQMLGLNELELIKRCGGGYSLGLGVSSEGGSFFIPYGALGINQSENDLQVALPEFLSRHGRPNLDSFSVAATADKLARFALAGRDRSDLQASLRYGLQLEEAPLCAYLRRYCQSLEVTFDSFSRGGCEVNYNDNGVSGFFCEGRHVTADFWVDVSSEVVAKEILKDKVRGAEKTYYRAVGWFPGKIKASASHSVWLGQGSVVEAMCGSQGTQHCTTSFSEIDLREIIKLESEPPAGWQFCTETELAEKNLWRKNYLCLGSAVLNMPGAACPPHALMLAGLMQFVDLYPEYNSMSVLAQVYNRYMQDFVKEMYSYHEAMWSQCSGEAQDYVSTFLRLKRGFERTGKLPLFASDAVLPQQWLTFLYGTSKRPELKDVTLDRTCTDTIDNALVNIEQGIRRLVSGMPEYRSFLTQLAIRHS